MHPFKKVFTALDCPFTFDWQLQQIYSFSQFILAVALKNQHTLLDSTGLICEIIYNLI